MSALMINDVACIKWYKVPRFYVELKRVLGKTKLRVKPKKRKWLWSAKGRSKLNRLRKHTREEVSILVDVKGILSLPNHYWGFSYLYTDNTMPWTERHGRPKTSAYTTQNKLKRIHAWSGIQNYVHIFRAVEDGRATRLGPSDHCYWRPGN